jgi:myo-inositol-1(or 4)-monophosphatase
MAHVPAAARGLGLDAELHAAIAAARAAAALIRAAAADLPHIVVREKKPNDFVSEVDIACEKAIAATLLAEFPTDVLRGEEGTQAKVSLAPGGTPAREWIVDPLDGTANFLRGYPAYAVSIALKRHGQIVLGVVLDVPRDELFCALRGAGAWSCRGAALQPLAVSGCTALASAIVAASCPPQATPRPALAVAVQAELLARCAAVRRSGSAALDLAWTAAGRTDAHCDFGLAPWDLAAGGLLVVEAGGRLTRWGGAMAAAHDENALEAAVEGGQSLGANPVLHAALSAILDCHMALSE